MNLIIIGNDTDKIAMEIWKANTNYYILNKNPYLFSNEFNDFIKNKSVIVSTTSQQFENQEINKVLSMFLETNSIPVLIADNDVSFENTMYITLFDEIPNTIMYTRNKEQKDYKEFIKIAQGYLLGKGIEENDRTVRTPKKRKRAASKK